MWIIAQYSTFTKVIDTDHFACINIEKTEDGGAISFESKKGDLMFGINLECSAEDFAHIEQTIVSSLNQSLIIPREFLPY